MAILELTKVISDVKIHNRYKNFIEDFITELKDKIGKNLHSVYMCGSIPRGTAIPYKSDADFTIVLHKDQDISEDLEYIKSMLIGKYQFVVKIDTPTITVDQIESNLYSWGFWIKVISICVYGEDIGLCLPPIQPKNELVLGINEDTIDTIERLFMEYKLADAQDKLLYKKRLLKKIIRALYSFTIVESHFWTDDFKEMKKWIIKYSGASINLVNSIYTAYEIEDHESNELTRDIEKSIEFIKKGLQDFKYQ